MHVENTVVWTTIKLNVSREIPENLALLYIDSNRGMNEKHAMEGP